MKTEAAKDRRRRNNIVRKQNGDRCGRTAQLNRIYRRDGGICGICHRVVARHNASRDHIIPLKDRHLHPENFDIGGDKNVRLAHKSCNSTRH